MFRIQQNPVKRSLLGLLAQFWLWDRAKADFCDSSTLQWSSVKSNNDLRSEVPIATWLHPYTFLPLLPRVAHSLCSRQPTPPHVDLRSREDSNPCWAVPSWYDFQPHNYNKIPDDETFTDSSFTPTRGTREHELHSQSSLLSPSYNSCQTGRWKISLLFNHFNLNYFWFFHRLGVLRQGNLRFAMGIFFFFLKSYLWKNKKVTNELEILSMMTWR